jgi:hypothetical protein
MIPMWLYVVTVMETNHGVPLAPIATPRHDDFDNMGKITFDEFIESHLPRPPPPGLLIFSAVATESRP